METFWGRLDVETFRGGAGAPENVSPSGVPSQTPDGETFVPGTRNGETFPRTLDGETFLMPRKRFHVGARDSTQREGGGGSLGDARRGNVSTSTPQQPRTGIQVRRENAHAATASSKRG